MAERRKSPKKWRKTGKAQKDNEKSRKPENQKKSYGKPEKSIYSCGKPESDPLLQALNQSSRYGLRSTDTKMEAMLGSGVEDNVNSLAFYYPIIKALFGKTWIIWPLEMASRLPSKIPPFIKSMPWCCLLISPPFSGNGPCPQLKKKTPPFFK